jgi:serine/threonine protein phosphatase PrpC
LTCIPDVKTVSIDQDATAVFVVACSDGIWDVVSNEEVGQIVAEAPSIQEVHSALFEHAAVDRRSSDDITTCVWRVK